MDIDRRIARIAMEDVLPPEIQWRRDKAGIDENFNLSMIKYGKKCIEDMIDKSDPIEDLFELGYLQELYEEFKSRYKKKNYDGIESDLIWRVYKTYQWLQG
jgi:asparagine synthase (glutamine-hydrolysing)